MIPAVLRVRAGLARAGLTLCLVFVSTVFLWPSAAFAADGDEGFGIRPEEGQVERLYQAVFDRSPDPEGFEYWARLRTSGTRLEEVAAAFTAAEEYQLRFGVDGDAEFVARLYDNVLDRAPDDGGADYWLAVLASGAPRTSVLIWFSESDELKLRTGTSEPELPPFEFTTTPTTAADLGSTWRVGCPVGVDDLVEIQLTHLDFEGRVVIGRIVMHRRAVDDTVALLRAMFDARMPIESMRPAVEFAGDDDALMSANVTSGFNCRTVAGTTRWSRHAFGEAIDVNPLYNPVVADGSVRPIEGAVWADRSRYHPAMIRAGDPLLVAADRLGWIWGGRWISLSDPHHLEMPR